MIAVEGGVRQQVTTPGGGANAVTRSVRGIMKGNFDIGYSLDQPVCGPGVKWTRADSWAARRMEAGSVSSRCSERESSTAPCRGRYCDVPVRPFTYFFKAIPLVSDPYTVPFDCESAAWRV